MVLVRDVQIQVAVVVRIQPQALVGVHDAVQIQMAGGIGKAQIAFIVEKSVGFTPTGNEQVRQTVVVVVGSRSAQFQVHLAARHQVAAQAGENGAINKRHDASVVDQQSVQITKADQINIRQAVVVKIAESHAVAVFNVRNQAGNHIGLQHAERIGGRGSRHSQQKYQNYDSFHKLSHKHCKQNIHSDNEVIKRKWKRNKRIKSTR